MIPTAFWGHSWITLNFWHSPTLPLAFKRSLWMPSAHYHQRELFLVYDHHRRHPEQFIIYKSFNAWCQVRPIWPFSWLWHRPEQKHHYRSLLVGRNYWFFIFFAYFYDIASFLREINQWNLPEKSLVPFRFEFAVQSSLLHEGRLRGKFKTRSH